MNSQGTVNPCCMFSPTMYKQEYNSLQEAFDGPENQELRKRMLAGEKISGCHKCDLYDDLGMHSYRKHFDKYDIENPKIRELEYSIDNTCNFKCVTCNSRFSHLWYEDDLELQRMGIPRQNTYAMRQKKKVQKTGADWRNLDLSELSYLKIIGGEPFTNQKYLEFLQNIDLSDVTIMIATNNSVFPKKWIDTLLTAKEVRLRISLDGVGDVGEFVRYGLDMEKFDKNFEEWKKLPINISFNYVYHILNCLNLEKTREYIGDYKLIIDYLSDPEYLDVKYAPDELKNQMPYEVWEYANRGQFNQPRMKYFIEYCNWLERRSMMPAECEYIYEQILSSSF